MSVNKYAVNVGITLMEPISPPELWSAFPGQRPEIYLLSFTFVYIVLCLFSESYLEFLKCFIFLLINPKYWSF